MITLCVIVKNEAATIEDTLKHALPAVDTACIIDTGSTDDTIPIVDRCIRGLPNGACYISRPWVDFSHNRNDCMRIARDRFYPGPRERHWLFMLDADTRLRGASRLLAFLRDYRGEHTAHYVKTQLGTTEYDMNRIFLADAPWSYTGKVHEVPVHAHGAEPGDRIPGVWVEYMGRDAGRKRATWLEHARILESEVAANPDDARSRFYLAQTYECLGNNFLARYWYRIRWSMTGSFDERWEAGLRLAALQHALGLRSEVLDTCAQLCNMKPHRAESWYQRALVLGDMGRWSQAAACAWLADLKMLPVNDHHFVRRDVYEYKARILRGIACQNTGLFPQAKRVFRSLEGIEMPQYERLLVAQRLASLI